MERNLEAVTQCSCCLETFEEPRNLPCSHTFCTSCLKKLLRLDGNVQCPLDRKIFMVRDVAQLPKNLALADIVDVLKVGGPISPRKVEFNHCPTHPAEQLKAWCDTCSALVCGDCVLSLHPKHDIVVVSQAANQRRSQLKEDLQKIKAIKIPFVSFSDSISHAIQNQNAHYSSTKEQLEKVFTELSTMINSRKTELFQQIDNKQQKQLALIQKQQQNFQDTIQEIQQHETHIQTIIDSKDDIQVMSMPSVVNEVSKAANQLSKQQPTYTSLTYEVNYFEVPSLKQKLPNLCPVTAKDNSKISFNTRGVVVENQPKPIVHVIGEMPFQPNPNPKNNLRIQSKGVVLEKTSNNQLHEMSICKPFLKEGIHYWTMKVHAVKGDIMIGIILASSYTLNGSQKYVGADAHSWGYHSYASKFHQAKGVKFGQRYGVGDVIGVLLNLSERTLHFFKNGEPLGLAYNNLPLGESYYPAVSLYGKSKVSIINDAEVPPLPEHYL